MPLGQFHTIPPRVIQYVGLCERINEEFKVIAPAITNEESEPEPSESSPVTLSSGNINLKITGKIDLSKFDRPKKEIVNNKKNYYIIDTNVFVNCPDIISKIDKEYPIILSAKVTDELDKMKIKLDEKGKQNAEKALRILNTDNTHNIIYEFADTSLLPDDFDKRSPDNMILSVALKYRDENPIMLTSDNGLQLKSKILGITTISLKKFLRR
jgi:predicted ribonuclease YlaK